jgi:serine/threonine protein kinase
MNWFNRMSRKRGRQGDAGPGAKRSRGSGNVLNFQSNSAGSSMSAPAQRLVQNRFPTIHPSKIIYDDPQVRLGGGAFGDVLKSKDNSFSGNKTVAVKVLLTRNIGTQDLQKIWKNLKKEAKAMHRVSHENLCYFHGLSSDPKTPFLVMEYIPGRPLRDYIGDPDIVLTEREKLRMAHEIAKGLEYLHCAISPSIVHGDLNPYNIMVKNDERRTIKIVDFGLARSTEGADGSITSSRNGQINIRYRAPELSLPGEKEEKENQRTDIYAFGGILNFVWTKKHPWSEIPGTRHSESVILRKQIGQERPELLSNSVLFQNDCLHKCWNIDPTTRPAITECKNEIKRLHDSIEGESIAEYCASRSDEEQECYRLLRHHENPYDALVATNPGSNCSVLEHVKNGSKPTFPGSPYISTSLNRRFVIYFGLKRMIEKTYEHDEPEGYVQRFVKIDLSKLGTEARIIDTARSNMAQNFAESAQEVLIKGRIPREAISGVYSFKFTGPSNTSNLLFKLLDGVAGRCSKVSLVSNSNMVHDYNTFARVFNENFKSNETEDALVELMRAEGPPLNAPIDWDAVEKVVGKKAADQMKQGEGFTGWLDLNYKSITDEGLRTIAPALRTMPNLEGLALGDNNIGDEGCRTIAPALRTMTNLKNLYLYANNIGDDSFAILCSRVLPEISLEILHLYGNKIGNVGCQSLLELFNNGSLPSLNELSLWKNPNISSELEKVFKRDWKAKGKNPRKLFF